MKLKTGDRFVFHNSKSNRSSIPMDVTLGRIYTVKDVCGGDAGFVDDAGDDNYIATSEAKYTKIVD